MCAVEVVHPPRGSPQLPDDARGAIWGHVGGHALCGGALGNLLVGVRLQPLVEGAVDVR